MIDHFVVRQAIYDKQLNIYAYKLLSSVNTKSDTTCAALDTLSEIGLSQLVGNYPAFINPTYRFIINHVDNPKFNKQLAIEISEDIEVSSELITTLKALSNDNHSIAIHNFTYQEDMLPLIGIVDIIKIDTSKYNKQELTDLIKKLSEFDLRLLANNVESQEDFKQYKDLGFDYFQGRFFCQPRIIGNQPVPANRITIVNLLAKLQDPDVNIEELETLISQDLALSFRLLKYINSAAFSLQREIDSIHHAIVLLGLNTILSLANLMLMANIDDKPNELLAVAIIRARMCEELGMKIDKSMKNTFFTAGLFSVIDALMDSTMEEIMSQLPLSPILKEALLEKKGIVGETLKCCIAFENAEWENVKIKGLKATDIQQAYFDAIIWSNEAVTFASEK